MKWKRTTLVHSVIVYVFHFILSSHFQKNFIEKKKKKTIISAYKRCTFSLYLICVCLEGFMWGLLSDKSNFYANFYFKNYFCKAVHTSQTYYVHFWFKKIFMIIFFEHNKFNSYILFLFSFIQMNQKEIICMKCVN